MMNISNSTRLLGHRGARDYALENTMLGFQQAQRLQSAGLNGVEFDVQLSADGRLIVFHDDTLERLCGMQSCVDQLNLIEIQRHLQSGHEILTLDRLATTLVGFDTIELEVKTHNRTQYSKLIQALIHELIDSPLAHLPIALTSFDVHLHAQLNRTRAFQSIPRGLLVRTPELLAAAPNTALQLGCRQLGVYYPLLTQKIIKNCHRYGLPVSAWTVNDDQEITQLINWGVDAVITDFPTQILIR